MSVSSLFTKQTFGSLIDGVESHRGETISLISPQTQRPWKELFAADAATAQQAIEVAHEAFRLWRLTTGYARGEMLRRLADSMVEHKDALALVMTMEMGKTLREGRLEVNYAAGFFRWYAGEAERVYGKIIPAMHVNKRLMLVHEPIGVCALISPWNFPLAMPARKLAAALAAGCTAVVKPSPLSPISALIMGHLCLHAGIPPGVVNVLYGPDEVLGDALTASPLVRKLSFTGSIPVGKKLYAACAATLKRITLELGGHSPFIVCHDASIERAVEGATVGKLRNSGQTCVSPNRFFVHADVYRPFVEAFAERMLALKVGDPLDPATEVSRVLHPASSEKVQRHVQDALSKGAMLHTAAEEPYYPKVLEGVTPEMQLFVEETFGPVASITSFDRYDKAVELANATNYGLAAYVFSEGLNTAHGLAEALECGIVGVNDALPSCPQASFGGIKYSGFGREGGPTGIDEYLVEKCVSMAF